MNIREWIRRDNEKAMNWTRAHPIKATSVAACLGYFTAMTTVMFAADDMKCVCKWTALGLLAATFVVWQIVQCLDLKKPMAVALALLMAPALRAAEPKPKEQVGPVLCVVGIGVVVGLGILGWKMIKRGDRIAKGRTNAWPEEIIFQTGEYGGLFSWAEYGHCPEELSSLKTPVVFTIDIDVKSHTNSTMTVSADVGKQYTESFDKAVAALGRRGLTIATEPGTHESYEIDGKAASHDQVPLSFNFETKTATVATGGILVTVDRSTDLQHWESFAKFNVPQGQHLTIPDVSEATATFWRVTTKAAHD